MTVQPNNTESDTRRINQSEWDNLKQSVCLNNGTTLAYVPMGSPDVPVIVFIHGMGDSSRAWTPFVHHFSNFRTLAIDIRNHGASTAATNNDVFAMAHDIVLLLSHLSIPSASFVGHSMGSLIVQILLSQLGSLVDKAILIASTGLVPVQKHDLIWQTVQSLKRQPKDRSLFSDILFANPGSVDEEFLAHEISDSMRIPLAVWEQETQAMMSFDPANLHYEQSDRVLIIGGRQDEIFSVSAQKALLTHLPDAQFTLYPTKGHNPYWEDPQSVARDIIDFLHDST